MKYKLEINSKKIESMDNLIFKIYDEGVFSIIENDLKKYDQFLKITI